jgi:hypothetical protein
LVCYWGNESQNRKFDILIDGQKLVTENIVGKWNKDGFVNVKYPIPSEIIHGKKKVTIMFKPHSGNRAGGIYDLRILRDK